MGINTMIEAAFELGPYVQEGCMLKERLSTIGYAVLFGSLASSALQSLHFGKAYWQIAGVNPAALEGSDLKSIDIRYQPPGDVKFSFGFVANPSDKLSVTVGVSGITGGYTQTLWEKPLEICGIVEVAKASLKLGGKGGWDKSGKGIFSAGLTAEIEYLKWGFWELPIFEIQYDLAKLPDFERARKYKTFGR
jgi:hypothetical protein